MVVSCTHMYNNTINLEVCFSQSPDKQYIYYRKKYTALFFVLYICFTGWYTHYAGYSLLLLTFSLILFSPWGEKSKTEGLYQFKCSYWQFRMVCKFFTNAIAKDMDQSSSSMRIYNYNICIYKF